MKSIALPLTALVAALSWVAPVQADSSTDTVAQSSLTTRQILEACVAGRANTLPNPYTDVSPDHWAYTAVLNMYYCGAFRQATPQSLIDRLSGDMPTRQGINSQSQSALPLASSSFAPN